MEKKSVSFAADIAEGARPLKRGATQIVNASEDDDDIFKDVEAKRRKEDNATEEEDDNHQSKHTLDSDEEEEDKYEKLDMKKVDGQEDCNIDYDGDTKITAFNMKEEEEDGHFDATGNFIFNKKGSDIKDAWLDDIDWSRVKKNAGKEWQEGKEEEDEDVPPPVMTDIKRKELFNKLLQLLKPDQTITKALLALKKQKGMSAAEERKARWAAKKAGVAVAVDEGGAAMAQLGAIGDELLNAGHMDAYEWTREKVSHLLSRLSGSAVDEVDIFSDAPATSSAKDASGDAPSVGLDDDVVMWEYKEDGEGDVKGPFTSEHMANLQAKDELGAKSVARKVGSASFNPTARIDFDLYV